MKSTSETTYNMQALHCIRFGLTNLAAIQNLRKFLEFLMHIDHHKQENHRITDPIAVKRLD